MRFVILGGGALGSIVAAHLVAAGEDVVLLARGARAAHVSTHGLSVTGLAELAVSCPVESDPSRVDGGDVLVVTVKTFDTAAALQPLSSARFSSVFSVQNGVLKNRQLGEVFGEAAVLGATGLLSGEVLDDGRVRFTLNEAVELGEPAGEASERARRIAEVLAAAGIGARAVPAIASREWSKFVPWSGFVSVAGLARLPTGVLLSDPGTARIVARVLRETAAVADALDIPLEDHPPAPAARLASGTEDAAVALLQEIGAHFRQSAPAHRVSILQDVERGRRLEIDETLGFTVSEARRLGVPVPTVETCYRMLGGIDRATRTKAG